MKRKKQMPPMTEDAKRWNKFAQEICMRDISTLSTVQRYAVLCFWYDAEMNSGGHCGFFSCFPHLKPMELVEAINTVAYPEISQNYLKALSEGELDEWVGTDDAYYEFEPSLFNCLQKYVEAHSEEIFL